MPSNKILHGPYGDAWAYFVEMPNFQFSGGWHRAENEAEALEKGKLELARWNQDLDAPVDRVEVPVRAPRIGSTSGRDASGHLTDGEYVERLYYGGDECARIEFSGACPVQGVGTVDGRQVYYRARGSGWSLSVELSDEEEWTYTEAPYAWPDGGWLHRDESMANIKKAVAAFRTRMGAK